MHFFFNTPIFGLSTNQSVPFGYLLHLLVQEHQGGLAEDIDGIRHKGLGDTTLVEVQSLLGAF